MSEDWIRFDRAVSLLEKRYGSPGDALEALHEMLIVGEARALAGEVARFENSPTFGVGGLITKRRSALRIPSKLWDRTSLLPALGSDWRASSFWATCTYMHWGYTTSGSKNEIRHISYRLRFVDVDRAGLIHLLDDPASRAAASLSSAVEQAKRWLDVRLSDPSTELTAKGAFQAEARSNFPGLSARGFDTAWRRAVAAYPDRSKAGKKPKAGG